MPEGGLKLGTPIGPGKLKFPVWAWGAAAVAGYYVYTRSQEQAEPETVGAGGAYDTYDAYYSPGYGDLSYGGGGAGGGGDLAPVAPIEEPLPPIEEPLPPIEEMPEPGGPGGGKDMRDRRHKLEQLRARRKRLQERLKRLQQGGITRKERPRVRKIRRRRRRIRRRIRRLRNR